MSDRRGTYRGIYSSLLDTLEFQALSSTARHIFLTMRLCSQNNAASIFRLYEGTLAEQTGYPVTEIRSALEELAAGEDPWIAYQTGLIWIKNGLRYDPSMRLSDKKHLVAVQRALSALPRCELVVKFCDYYKIARPFDGPGRTHTQSGTPSPIPNPIPNPIPIPIPSNTLPRIPRRSARANGLPEGFLTWWEQYPKKVGRIQAVKEWEKLTPDESLQAVMIEAVKNQRRTVKAMIEGDRHHILDPERWIKYRRWEDVLTAEPTQALQPTPVDPKTLWKNREEYREARKAGRVSPSHQVPEWNS